jgi:hypothetical protein
MPKEILGPGPIGAKIARQRWWGHYCTAVTPSRRHVVMARLDRAISINTLSNVMARPGV